MDLERCAVGCRACAVTPMLSKPDAVVACDRPNGPMTSEDLVRKYVLAGAGSKLDR
jgi:hypothetical protein